jgi:hypothetical protein
MAMPTASRKRVHPLDHRHRCAQLARERVDGDIDDRGVQQHRDKTDQQCSDQLAQGRIETIRVTDS